MTDTLDITIRLADQPPMKMRGIARADEEAMRRAEYNINRLWSEWRTRFRDRTPEYVMAMVAFRYAHLYYEMEQRSAATAQALDSATADVEALLARVTQG